MKKILYIEDNTDTADAVKIILENAGFGVELTYTGEEGIGKAKAAKFDLIIIDIMLPDISGWTTLQMLKEKNIKSKFAFISAIPLPQKEMAKLRQEGVLDYIEKPFENADLIARVKRILMVAG